MQILITSVFAAGTDEISVGVEIRERETVSREKFLISASLYTELGITKGECDEELYVNLSQEARIYAAFKRGMSILGFGGCSEKMLISKLISKGFDKESAQIAAARIRDKGFLCEQSNARREAERCAAKLWGPIRIRAHLASKGYGSDAVDDAVFSLEDNGVDFEDSCVRLVVSKCKANKLPRDREELQKLIASVMRCGYSSGQVKHALAAVANRKASIYD